MPMIVKNKLSRACIIKKITVFQSLSHFERLFTSSKSAISAFKVFLEKETGIKYMYLYINTFMK